MVLVIMIGKSKDPFAGDLDLSFEEKCEIRCLAPEVREAGKGKTQKRISRPTFHWAVFLLLCPLFYFVV